MSELGPPYESIAGELVSGTVVPFFGSAASAVYRPPGAAWEHGKPFPFLPTGAELAAILARAGNFTAANAAYEAALSELAHAAAEATSGVPPDAIKAALQPVLGKHFGGPPGLALIASWFEYVQMNSAGPRTQASRGVRGHIGAGRASYKARRHR